MNTKTMKTGWFKTAMAVVAVSLAALGAYGAEKIKVDKVSNHYPWDGKVDCVYTLSGLDSDVSYTYKCAFTLSVEQGGATVSKTVDIFHQDITGGTFTNTFDCTELFGAGAYPNGGIAVDLVKTDYVQLWAGGPYFATRNYGATTPSDYGYFFWWGDNYTTGYQHTGSGWKRVTRDLYIGFKNSEPANWSCMSIAALLSNGWIDSTGNLAPTHDVIRERLGAPWRHPTSGEMADLSNESNCSWTWTSNWRSTGIKGYEVRGVQPGYTNKYIFLPAGGIGNDWQWNGVGEVVNLWTSSPKSGDNIAYALIAAGKDHAVGEYYRWIGVPIRPVRSAE